MIRAAARTNALVERAERLIMRSFKQLHEEWATLHATFARKIRESETAPIISSDVQYATASWHNKLKVWCDELDQLMAEYSSEFGHSHLTSLREGQYPAGAIDRPQDSDAARV